MNIGDRVYFGRKQGEKTLGEIVKINAKSVKVTVIDGSDLSDVSGARVLLLADTGGFTVRLLPSHGASRQTPRLKHHWREPRCSARMGSTPSRLSETAGIPELPQWKMAH